MGWIAKAKYDPNGKTYGKVYESIYDCQKYIDEELQDEMEIQRKNMYKWCYEHGHRSPGMPDKYDELDPKQMFIINVLISFRVFNNPILCYNTEQKRFCDGFDF